MKFTVEVEIDGEEIQRRANAAAAHMASQLIDEEFRDEYGRKGEATQRLNNEVSAQIRALDMRQLVAEVLATRLELAVRDRVDAYLAKSIDKELARRKAEGAQLSLGGGT